MHRSLIVTTAVAAMALAQAPAQAGDGRVAAGVIGGLAVGTMLGVAAAQPRPYYYAAPAPVYVEPGPPVGCYWTRGRPVWDGYRGVWVRPRVQVCD